MKVIGKRLLLFSSQKHFVDGRYQNFVLETLSKHGSLSHIAKIFADSGSNICYIKSRFNSAWTSNKNYVLDVTIEKPKQQAIQQFKEKFSQIGVKFLKDQTIKVPWFPRTLDDLNKIGKVLLDVKDEVNKDHLQFSDPEYRKRRDFIAEVALNYKMGQPIPDVPYNQQENALWRRIYASLSVLHEKGMSQRYQNQMKKLQKEFLISQRIPQLNELNTYLFNKTGFNIKPTHGILSQRQFLNCFAFKIFCCTQYLRHTKSPDYTPEPDIVHEIIGHVPMFANPQVAEMSHQIGLLSLGATDEQIAMLGTLYWFTLQFGACLENGKRLGYGAGIASSIGELQNFMGNECQFKKFEPFVDCHLPYPIQKVQDTYRVTQSFDEALQDLQRFGRQINKPISTTYNYKTNSIDYNRNIQGIDFGDKGPTF